MSEKGEATTSTQWPHPSASDAIPSDSEDQADIDRFYPLSKMTPFPLRDLIYPLAAALDHEILRFQSTASFDRKRLSPAPFLGWEQSAVVLG